MFPSHKYNIAQLFGFNYGFQMTDEFNVGIIAKIELKTLLGMDVFVLGNL